MTHDRHAARYRYIDRDCDLTGKTGVEVTPSPGEPRVAGTIKIRFDGMPAAVWVGCEQVLLVEARAR